MLYLGCFAFYRTLQLLIIKRYATNDFAHKNLPKCEFEQNATFKKQAKPLNNKALAEFNTE